MVRTIEKIGRIIRIGHSKGIIIDKDTLKYLELDIGDMVKLFIEKVKDSDKKEE